MPSSNSSPAQPGPAWVFAAPTGDILAARSTASTLLTPPPPPDVAAMATLVVTAALLEAGLACGDRVTEDQFKEALKALLRAPRKALRDSPMVFVAYVVTEQINLPQTQNHRLKAWLEDRFGVGARRRASRSRASEPEIRPRASNGASAGKAELGR